MNKAKGFTIIEVMIVLVIAASILSMVFLVTPALQRNNANTKRKSDVGRVLGSLGDYSSNNNGSLPADNTVFQNSVLASISLVQFTSSNIVWYSSGDPAILSQIDISGTSSKIKDNNDKVIITPGAKCLGMSAVTGSSRQVVAMYNADTRTGLKAEQCVEL